MITKEQHIAFYELEIQTQLDEWRAYIRKRMNLLIKDKDLFIGRFWDVDEDKGSVIFRFKRRETPRLNWPYFFGIVGNDAGGAPTEWLFTFQDFLYSHDMNYYSQNGSDGEASSILRTEGEYAFLEAIFEDSSFFECLKTSFMVFGIKPLVVVAKKYPPIAYLTNLKEFVQTSGSNYLSFNADENTWNPTDIDNENVSVNYFIDLIASNKTLLIQGPPGTGKSYRAAEICKYYLEKNKSVAVCALTNKAIIEIVNQPALEQALEDGKIFKTNISKDEQKANPHLRPIEGFIPSQGNLLLTTYYKLSEFYKSIITDSKRFDLLIIEEASQAFFATFAMFFELSQNILIIGDQKQLSPIVTAKREKLLRISPKIDKVQLGLETLAGTISQSSTYRLTKTRRLTSDCSDLTGLFYNNSLLSSSPLNGKIIHSSKIQSVFHPNGAVSIASMDIVGENALNQTSVFNRVNLIIKEILAHSTNTKVAILVPTIYLEQQITQAVGDKGLFNSRITISTIHRIQGITTDYTIYYMPLTNVHFELDPKLFNVATSRAKRGTLIITNNTLLMNEMDKQVHHFLSRCVNVTSSFIKLISN